jgi:NADH-quinone oxidoreductase subunit J
MNCGFLIAQATQVQTASAVLFYLFAALTAAASLGVVCSRNIVRTAVWLLFALIGVAGLFFLLEAEFLAAVQLVIYAGGTLIP